MYLEQRTVPYLGPDTFQFGKHVPHFFHTIMTSCGGVKSAFILFLLHVHVHLHEHEGRWIQMEQVGFTVDEGSVVEAAQAQHSQFNPLKYTSVCLFV